MSPALVHPFMRSVMEAPFPAPGRTITVRSFLPGAGNEVMESRSGFAVLGHSSTLRTDLWRDAACNKLV